jgi:hypothetical protein
MQTEAFRADEHPHQDAQRRIRPTIPVSEQRGKVLCGERLDDLNNKKYTTLMDRAACL